MTTNDRIQSVRSTGANRWVQVVRHHVCIFALLLQVLIPVTAQASEGTWIEICGQSGAELVRVDAIGDEPQPTDPTNCMDCGPCVLCAVAEPVTVPFLANLLPATAVAQSRQWTGFSEVKPNAAQFWPVNRGPPMWLANTQKVDHSPMTSSLYLGGAWS